MRITNNWHLYEELERLVETDRPQDKKRIEELRKLFNEETRTKGKRRRYLVVDLKNQTEEFDSLVDVMKKYGANRSTILRSIDNGIKIGAGKMKGYRVEVIP